MLAGRIICPECNGKALEEYSCEPMRCNRCWLKLISQLAEARGAMKRLYQKLNSFEQQYKDDTDTISSQSGEIRRLRVALEQIRDTPTDEYTYELYKARIVSWASEALEEKNK